MDGKGLSADVLALLDGEARIVKYALSIGTSTPVRVCTGIGPIVIDSNKYEQRGFKASDVTITADGGTRCTVVVDDLEDLPNQASTLIELSYSERLTGKEASVMLTVLNEETGTWCDAVVLISGTVTRCSGDGKAKVTLQIDERAGERRRACLHVGSRSCTNTFKGSRCGYVGVLTTCNGSWDDCVARGRTVRYRGLRWALEPGAAIQIGGDRIVLEPPVRYRYRHIIAGEEASRRRVSDVAGPPEIFTDETTPLGDIDSEGSGSI